MKDIQLTKDFWLHEFLVSRDYPELAAAMRPDVNHISNLYILCATILQPARDAIKAPIIVKSGLRIDGLNEAVKGHSKSLHPFGKAADVTTVDVIKLYQYILLLLPCAYVQLIWYKGRRFVHVAIPHLGAVAVQEVRG